MSLSAQQIQEAVTQKLAEDESFMPQTLASELGVSLGAVLSALPEEMRAEAPASAFTDIWEAMCEWEKVTFMASTSGAILEIPCRLPKGKIMHGMYNLMDKESFLRGHLLMGKVASIRFISKPVFGVESHSVQFLDEDGAQCFAVYLGRNEKREIIPSVKEGFMNLKARFQ